LEECEPPPLRARHVLDDYRSRGGRHAERSSDASPPWGRGHAPTRLRRVNLNAAGVDVGAGSHYVAVPDGRDPEGCDVREFRAFTADLYALADWLTRCDIETVAMESTGVYWIQQLHTFGLLAAALRDLVAAGADVRPTRAMSLQGRGGSGFPKWMEAARYYIKSLGVREDARVWNVGSTDCKQDINSRPLYANFVKANILVSIHNNAGHGGFSGTETWYDTSTPWVAQSRRLADLLQLEVVKMIREFDKNWKDRGLKHEPPSKAENKRATRPSAIVEIAFGDRLNPDNTALQNDRFKQLASCGIVAGVARYLVGDGAAGCEVRIDEAKCCRTPSRLRCRRCWNRFGS
jgi:hypothetical protein